MSRMGKLMLWLGVLAVAIGVSLPDTAQAKGCKGYCWGLGY